ncbi:response regulator transcription factor [Jeotgalibacillus sp. R-1-5s-1]|uniref:response regulator transcription factor n=1 Tax=Jeotgalibacillus sp. R-1-5s-1 TaxID=2555897 RepID=UPI00106D0985|nr:response regulator transcription factor [Jeotgalibacillus sp. R-1-5s-1]TFE03316.1 response regulator transcription factor [Jeotgalibacillus sp. R-1-5s-1]
MTRILLIEDEKNLARFIELELKYEGYEVSVEYDGRDGLNLALTEEFDLILLDLMLPSLSGMEICRRIRQAKDLPIIMITAKDGVMDRVSGLDSGADDYIVKPFAIEELLARMRALLRRLSPVAEDALSHKDLSVNLKSYKVIKGNEELTLTKREFDLLKMLLENKDIVLTRDRILEKVWGYDAEVETNVVDVYIRHLRNKLDPEQSSSYIETVRGTGYVIRS